MAMLDDAFENGFLFDRAPIAPGALAQMFSLPRQAAPQLPPPIDVQPAPTPAMPAMPPDARAQVSDADIPPTSPMGRMPEFFKNLGGGVNDFIGNNRATLMALASGLMGAQNVAHGLQRAGQLLPAAAQQDIAQQKQNQTARWLMSKGMSPQEAEAVVNNPEMLKQLLPRLMGARQLKWTTTKDWLGNEKGFFVDEAAGRRYDEYGREITPTSPGADSGGLTIPTGPDGQPLQGQPLLDHLKKTAPEAAAGIQAIVRGDLNAGGRNLQKLLPVAALVDPSLHQWDYASRAKTNQFYKTGPGGMESKSANTAVNHLDDLRKIDARLGGFDFGGGYLNSVTQGAKRLMGDSDFQDAKREWDSISETAAVEIAKTINGGKPHVGDENHWRGVFAAASTPTERKAAIRSAAELIEGRRTESEANYEQGMGPAKKAFPSLVEPFSFINPRNQEKYDRLLRYGHETPAAKAETVAPSSASTAGPPAPAIAALRQRPELAAQFDAKYGAGASRQYLGAQ